MMKKIALNLVFLLFAVLSSAQQKLTVSGYVTDARTGEALQGAVIYTSDKTVGVSANEFGFYSLSLPEGEYVIVCDCLAYSSQDNDLKLKGKPASLNFELQEDDVQLDAARVFSRSKREILKMPQMGSQTIDAGMVRRMPSLLGEPDIIRTIQMLPGVQTPSEGSTGFSVRGGGVDQNLILMDGAPIFNSGHFLGFFSMFNSDAIKNAQLYKGDYPAQYGGRNSSVLDISMTEGNMKHFEGNASIGLIASKIFLEGPIVKDKLSFMVSARRSYLDLFFPLFRNYFSEKTKLSFFDVNAKITWNINDRNRLYVSAFGSGDEFGMELKEMKVDQMVFNYKNNIQSVRWNHLFSPNLFTDVSFYNTNYKAGATYAKPFAKDDLIAILVCTLNEEFYDFYSSYLYNEQSHSIPLISSQPANLITNIKGDSALGFFTTCPVQIAACIVDDPNRKEFRDIDTSGFEK